MKKYFLDGEIQSHRDFSEVTARMIDEEVVRIVRKAQSTAEQVLNDNIDLLHNLAKALLEHETIDGVEVDAIMEGKPIIRSKNGSAIKPPKKKPKRRPPKNRLKNTEKN